MVRCVVTGAIRAALLVSTCLCPCYKGCCSVTCLESTFQAHRGTFPAWDEHPSIGDAGVAISWPSLPVRTRGACFPRVQDRGCPGEPAQKQPCWCSPGCSRCLAWTGAPGLRRGQPPPPASPLGRERWRKTSVPTAAGSLYPVPAAPSRPALTFPSAEIYSPTCSDFSLDSWRQAMRPRGGAPAGFLMRTWWNNLCCGVGNLEGRSTESFCPAWVALVASRWQSSSTCTPARCLCKLQPEERAAGTSSAL